jgi:hypothetical protein
MILARWVLTKFWSPEDATAALDEAVEGDRPPRQCDLMKPEWAAFISQAIDSLDPRTMAQVVANGQPMAKAWLDAAPVERSLDLSDATVVAGLLQRLQLPAHVLSGACRQCGMLQPPQGHSANCFRNSGPRAQRHEKLKKLLARLYKPCKQHHITKVVVEPQSTNSSQRRADLLVTGAAAPSPPSSCIDVSIVSLTSQESIRAIDALAAATANRKGLGHLLVATALSVRFKKKLASYVDVELPGKLLPFVVSTEGAVHEESWDAIKKLKAFKYGANVRRFILQSSCSLLRDRAASFFFHG